jgi:tetratricopeptide (TPR) repeat protein
LLAKQHRFFELDSELADLGDGQSFDDHDNLSRQTASALQQAREKYDQATDFEHQGNPGRALDAFKQVEAVVSDYPGLLEDIERTNQAKELLGDWSQAPETIEEEVDTPTEEEKEKKQDPSANGAKRGKRKTGATKLFEDTARNTSRMIPYVSGIILVLVLVSAGGYYYLNSLKLDKARAEFSECQTILKQNRFSDAERQCATAIDTAKQIQYFKAKSRDGLIAEIKTVLNSEALQQGLAGNRLLDGQYLPKKMVRTILAFKHFIKEGDEQFASENWQKAASNYAEALKLAEQKEGVAQELVFEVTENLKIAQFNILLRSGTEFVKRGKWVLATNDLEQALEQVKNLGIEDKAATVDAISVQLSDIALATTKQQADSAFADEKYDEAVKYYKRALDVIRKTNQPDSPELKNLKELVVKAEL